MHLSLKLLTHILLQTENKSLKMSLLHHIKIQLLQLLTHICIMDRHERLTTEHIHGKHRTS